MLEHEIEWITGEFSSFRDHVYGLELEITELREHSRQQLEHAHRKLDAIVSVARHLLPFIRGLNPMDHAELKKLVEDTETKLMSAADEAVAEFEKVEADHSATVTTAKEALDDVGTLVAAWPEKLAAKLAVIKAPASTETGAAGSASAPISVAIAAPTTAPTVTIPVSADVAASTAVGSTLAGPGIPNGATVLGTTDNHPQTGGPALTIDDATTADHAAGDVVTVTPPAAG